MERREEKNAIIVEHLKIQWQEETVGYYWGFGFEFPLPQWLAPSVIAYLYTSTFLSIKQNKSAILKPYFDSNILATIA